MLRWEEGEVEDDRHGGGREERGREGGAGRRRKILISFIKIRQKINKRMSLLGCYNLNTELDSIIPTLHLVPKESRQGSR